MTESPPLTAPVLVVGVGNILLGDDGIGVRLAQELGQRLLLAGVEVVDGGTLGLSLLPYLAGREVLVVLDAMRNGQPPGTLQWLRWPQGWQGKSRRSVSPHQGSALELLHAASLIGILPPVVWLGVVTPAEVNAGVGLSPVVESRLPSLVAEVAAFLRTLALKLLTNYR